MVDCQVVPTSTALAGIPVPEFNVGLNDHPFFRENINPFLFLPALDPLPPNADKLPGLADCPLNNPRLHLRRTLG